MYMAIVPDDHHKEEGRIEILFSCNYGMKHEWYVCCVVVCVYVVRFFFYMTVATGKQTVSLSPFTLAILVS